MNKNAVAVLSVVVLVGVASVWLNVRKSGSASETVLAATALPIEVPPIAPAVEVPAMRGEIQQDEQGITREKVFPRTPGASVGFYTKHASVDFDTYLVFMEVGAASELLDGKMTDETSVQFAKNAYGLTDDEVARLINYSRSVLIADRSFQAIDQGDVCDKKATYQTVQEFGAALNEHTKRIEGHQETLGRNAAKVLGSELYNKISDKVLSRPRREMTNADFPVLMGKRNHGLEVEVERFCNFGK
jgi:hypothetical protein